MSTCAALARCHRLSAITGILSALPWNECPRGTGFRNLDARSVKELLLVPFVGACIHVPPLPSNQVIHVMALTGFKFRDLFDPVWVTGRLTVMQSSTDLADAGYALAADTIAIR